MTERDYEDEMLDDLEPMMEDEFPEEEEDDFYDWPDWPEDEDEDDWD